MCREKDAGTWARIPVILFDFTVHSGNVTVSTIASYDRNNLYLRNGTKNVIDNTGAILDTGNVICAVDNYGNPAWATRYDPRRNETDLYGKVKGIARNESAWIDSDIEVVIDDNTELGTPIPLALKDSYYTYGISNPKWSWKSSINPLNDAWDGVLTMLPNGLHNFKYHYTDTSRQWYFDFQHRDLRYCNINGNGPSVNDSVPSDIIDNAKRDMATGRKEHFAADEAPDEYAMSIGEWGATYHSSTVLGSTHPYSSRWYQWPVMYRPIWFYSGTVVQGAVKEGISSFGNPAVWWAGIAAFIYMVYLAAAKRDRKALFLIIAYLAQFMPWIPISRLTFIYHYFPSVPFVVLMIGYSICSLCEGKDDKNTMYASFVYAAAAIALFAMFYPVLSGHPCTVEYAKYLKWFGTWVLL